MVSKRGLSSVVSSVLVILLVMGSIGVVWVIVQNALTDSEGKISRGGVCVDNEVKILTCVSYDNDEDGIIDGYNIGYQANLDERVSEIKSITGNLEYNEGSVGSEVVDLEANPLGDGMSGNLQILGDLEAVKAQLVSVFNLADGDEQTCESFEVSCKVRLAPLSEAVVANNPGNGGGSGNNLILNVNEIINLGTTGRLETLEKGGQPWDFSGNDFTIIWWEKRESNAPGNPSFSRDQTNNFPAFTIGFGLSANSNSLATYMTSATNGWNIAISETLGLSKINEWTHFALVNSGNDYITYQEGVEIDRWVSNVDLKASTEDLWIGGYRSGGTVTTDLIFDGKMTKIKVYDKALSSSEIGNIYVSESGDVTGGASVGTLKVKEMVSNSGQDRVGKWNDFGSDGFADNRAVIEVDLISPKTIKRIDFGDSVPANGYSTYSTINPQLYPAVIDYQGVQINNAYLDPLDLDLPTGKSDLIAFTAFNSALSGKLKIEFTDGSELTTVYSL